ncbi:MAG: thioredoxin domain-containing protein, partial [Xanthomarina sp.]
LDLMLNYTQPFYEVIIAGSNAHEKIKELNKEYIPNKILAGSTQTSALTLLENRFIDDQTFIYVCVNQACKLPIKDVKEAINQIKNNI